MSIQYTVLVFEPMTLSPPITTRPGRPQPTPPIVAVMGSPVHVSPQQANKMCPSHSLSTAAGRV